MRKLPKALIELLRSQRFAVLGLYLLLAGLYFAILGEEFLAAINYPNWLIAPIMTFGSFVAGATFLGGGSVAFPALTKILQTDPITAKTFSLAIQSVGMTSASIYIVSRVRNLPINFMLLYLIAAAVGMAISLTQLELRIPAIDLRISFTLFIVCFLSVYLISINEHTSSLETHLERSLRDTLLTVFCGLCGGLVSGLLGSGADLIGFSLLVLYFRIEIKRATQISVILMAATAVIGSSFQYFIQDSISDQVIDLWLIAAPVVLFGAPLGAVFCRRISAKFLMIFICTIVLVEVASTLALVSINTNRIFIYGIAGFASVALLLFFRHLAHYKHQ